MTVTRSELNQEVAFYRKKLLLSMIIPGIIVFLMWLVKFVEILFETDFSHYRHLPVKDPGNCRYLVFTFYSLQTSVICLIIHCRSFFSQLRFFYFYSEVAFSVFAWTYFLTGLLVWIAGREAWHIGASGVVYGLASFLFFSGIIRRHFRLIALSLLIVFLYGSMVWGLFPGSL